MPDDKKKLKKQSEIAVKDGKVANVQKTVIKSLGLGGMLGGGAPCAVDVNNSKIVRVRPLHYDWKYDSKSFNQWKLTRNGKVYKPNFKSQLSD